jgi:hypothetical protein
MLIDDGGVLQMVDAAGRRFVCSYCSHSSRHTRADIRHMGYIQPLVYRYITMGLILDLALEYGGDLLDFMKNRDARDIHPAFLIPGIHRWASLPQTVTVTSFPLLT